MNSGSNNPFSGLNTFFNFDGTIEFTFTPDAGLCATTATMNIVIEPKLYPTFVDPVKKI